MFTNPSAEANEELNENEEILSAVNLDELQVSAQKLNFTLKIWTRPKPVPLAEYQQVFL